MKSLCFNVLLNKTVYLVVKKFLYYFIEDVLSIKLRIIVIAMMNRSPDIMFMAEYIKNVLYFATVRQGKTLKNTVDTHYFSIDNELVYENYYSDFGPLNLGCVYKYCRILNEKIDLYLNKQTIVHYTSIEPKKKANSAFLLGCYGVLYLSLTPRDALKPLLVHGQNYRYDKIMVVP